MAGARPGGVTLIAVLVWISGVLSIIGAIVGLLAGAGIAGWISLILGILTVAVGVGLLRGSGVARVLATIVLVLNLAAAVYVLVTAGFSWYALITGVLSLIALIMLFTRRANAFFRG